MIIHVEIKQVGAYFACYVEYQDYEVCLGLFASYDDAIQSVIKL